MRDFNLDALAIIASKPSPASSSNIELSVSEVLPLDQHPAAVYLAWLRENSRRPQKNALDKIARILSGEEANCFDLDWSSTLPAHQSCSVLTRADFKSLKTIFFPKDSSVFGLALSSNTLNKTFEVLSVEIVFRTEQPLPAYGFGAQPSYAPATANRMLSAL